MLLTIVATAGWVCAIAWSGLLPDSSSAARPGGEASSLGGESGWDYQPATTTQLDVISESRFARHDATIPGRRADDEAPVASAVTMLLGENQETLYEIHSEVLETLAYAEYVTVNGLVGNRSIRLRIKQVATGHQASIVPFGVDIQAIKGGNASLTPTFYHFAYRASGRQQSVSAFVSSGTGRHEFHHGHGRAEWKSFIDPFLTQYWAAFVADYNLTRSSVRRGWADDAAGYADDAINWGEGRVDSWVPKESGNLGAKVGGDLGAAAGSMAAGPVGGAIGNEVGSYLGRKAGSYLGNAAMNDGGRAAVSNFGSALKSDVNSWASSEDSGGGGGGWGW